MPVVGVDAARPDQADEMEPAIGPDARAAGVEQRWPLEEGAVRDRRIDPRQVLEDRTPGAEVQVPDLRVAHLPGRQPDRVL